MTNTTTRREFERSRNANRYKHLQDCIAAKICPLCSLPVSFETRDASGFLVAYMVCKGCKLRNIANVFVSDLPRESDKSISDRHETLRAWGF